MCRAYLDGLRRESPIVYPRESIFLRAEAGYGLNSMTNGSSIEVRQLSFEVERGAGGLWNAQRPELSHTLNAFQLALPYLEPYFIDAVRQAADRIEDPKLRADAIAFCAQEANHSRQHQRYCRFLRQRYPRLKEYETAIQQSLVKSRQEDSLEWRLAYTAGYEAITAQLSRFMFRNADDWFRDADPHFAALMMWHAAEEIEHRHVAFDVLNAVTRSYRLRAKGLFAAIRKTYADMTPVVSYMLEVDGVAGRLDCRARRLKLRVSLAANLFPALLRYLAPGYHPSKDPEPSAFARWLTDYAEGGGGGTRASEASAVG
jgi:predicted metal-dependent hydrolase